MSAVGGQGEPAVDAPDGWPRGTVTFLFSDIEGSSRRWEVHGDLMVDCVTRHDELLGGAIESVGGTVVKSTGDGVMAAFSSAEAALVAALAGQAAIGAEDWGPVPSLRVRMGIHTGPCEPTGEDYYGAVVGRAARIGDAGHGAQVLLSQVSVDLLDSGGPLNRLSSGDVGFELVSRGPQRLKDLSEPIELFQVQADCLDNELLPLRVLDVETGHLPVQRTSFIGRQEELVAAATALEETRLVALLGPGGVGKTRLSLQLGAEVYQRFPAGAWFIDLTPVPRDQNPAAAVLDQLTHGAPSRDPGNPGETPEDALAREIGSSERLLILDNCEHVIDATSRLVDRLLGACPSLRIVATSREALAIQGERIVRVDPFDVASTGPQGLPSPAVQLFIDRMVAGGRTAPDQGEQLVVARICELVDGLPLAVELAASRALHMPLADLETRLGSQIEILEGRDRTKPARHLSMHALLQWSYDHLDLDQQVVLQRMALFAGPVDLATIEELGSGNGVEHFQVFSIVSTLVEQSLVTYDESSGSYRLLSVIRHFARTRMAEEEVQQWRERHMHWCDQRLEEAAATQSQQDVAEVVQALGAEFSAAVAWAMETGQAPLAMRLAGRGSRLYERTGRVREGFDLVHDSLNLHKEPPSRDWAIAATAAASLAVALGDIDYATDLNRAAAQAFAEAGDHEGEAWSLVGLAPAMALNGAEEAREWGERALENFASLADRRGIGHAHAALGVIATRERDPSSAERHFLESLSVFRLAGERRDTASVLANLGNISYDRRDYLKAGRFFDGALQIHRELDDRRGAALILNNLCIVAQARGDIRRAREIAAEALEAFADTGDHQGLATAHYNLGNLALADDDADVALVHYDAAIGAFREARDVRGLVTTLATASDAARDADRRAVAWRHRVEEATVLTRLGLDTSARRAVDQLIALAVDFDQGDLAAQLTLASESIDLSAMEPVLTLARHEGIAESEPAPASSAGDELVAALTGRQQELLVAVGEGKTNAEIADELFISVRTVDAHLSHIRSKLGITERTKLVVFARERL